MPNQFHRAIQDYVSKIKKPPTPQLNLSSSSSWMLRSCKHPKTPSFVVDDESHTTTQSNNNHDEAATLSDIDRFLHENFKSLYLKKSSDATNEEEEDDDDDEKLEKLSDMTSFDLPRFKDPPVSNIYTNHRSFFKGSGSEALYSSSSSNSKDKYSTRAGEQVTKEEELGPDEFITILTYSSSPHDDFRKSMQEILEARLNHNNGKVNWEFMEELLFCYLNLNDKKSYKYILRAFVDLVVAMRENSSKIST